MIVFNKYLEEIGIKKDSFPFTLNCPDDSRYIPDETGISIAETFSMDYTLSLVIYSYLKKFKETGGRYGCPSGLTEEKWTKILNTMIDGFKLMIVDGSCSNSKEKKKKKALKLFCEYYHSLWW